MKNIKKGHVLSAAFLLFSSCLLFYGCAPKEPAPTVSPKPTSRIITANDIKDFVRGDPIEAIIEKLGEPMEKLERPIKKNGTEDSWFGNYLYTFEDGRILNIATQHDYLVGISVQTEDGAGDYLPRDKVTGFNGQDFTHTLCLNRHLNFAAMRKSADTVYLFFTQRQKFNLASSMDDTIQVAVEPEDSEDMEALTFYVRFVNGDTVNSEYVFKYNEETSLLEQVK